MTGQDERWKALTIEPLTETDARNVCAWRYPVPYDVYNYGEWEMVERMGWDIAQPEKRDSDYVSIKYMNGLVAFGRLSRTRDYVLIGIGLRPDFCDRGMGGTVLEMLVALAMKRYPGMAIGLEVRTFNSRAIRCYEKCGFKRYKRYTRNTCSGEDAFQFMVYDR